jgi:hypothetical protein
MNESPCRLAQSHSSSPVPKWITIVFSLSVGPVRVDGGGWLIAPGGSAYYQLVAGFLRRLNLSASRIRTGFGGLRGRIG